MTRFPDLERFAARHGLKLVSIARIVEYRHRHGGLVRRAAENRTLRSEELERTVTARRHPV